MVALVATRCGEPPQVAPLPSHWPSADTPDMTVDDLPAPDEAHSESPVGESAGEPPVSGDLRQAMLAALRVGAGSPVPPRRLDVDDHVAE